MMYRNYISLFFLIWAFIISCSDKSTNINEKTNTAPTASFNIDPDSGDTNTIFHFDASTCTDKEDPLSVLEVRWDWENDGIWDTEYSKTKIITHQFLSIGIKSIALEVKDTGGLTDSTIHYLTVLEPNTPPRASFVISLTSGTTSTIFKFDASDSWDDQDSTLLEYRWDWENDGNWDTEYSTMKTASHQYSEEGIKTVKLEVRDSGGLTDSTTRQLTVSNEPFTDTTVTDIDGNVYKIVKIGDQWWMAENLKVTHYRNGDPLPKITDNTEWENLRSGAYCSYGNKDENIGTYGLLYNWYAVNDARSIAPEGWHIPSEAEWQTLINYLGGNEVAGGKMKLQGTSFWKRPNTGATNESGFSALPGGFRDRRGEFLDIKVSAKFWINDFEYTVDLYYNGNNVGGMVRFKGDGASIRCVKD